MSDAALLDPAGARRLPPATLASSDDFIMDLPVAPAAPAQPAAPVLASPDDFVMDPAPMAAAAPVMAAPEPSLAETVTTLPPPAPMAGPPPEKSGFFTGIGAGGQEALRLGTRTLGGQAFEVDPNAPPPDTGDEGWWYRFGKGVGYSAPTLAAGLGGGAIGTGIGAAMGPAAPVSAPVLGIAGAGLGVGAMSLAQDLAPVYEQQIQTGKSHDEAVNYAWQHATATGVISGLTAYLPGPFRSAAGQILYQTFFTQPASGAAVRAGVPLVMGEPLPSVGEFIEGAGQDVMAGAGFTGAHIAGRRAVQAVTPTPPAPSPTAGSNVDIGARETLAPTGLPSATEQVGVPAPAPSLSRFPLPSEVSRVELAPEQFPATAAPVPPAGEPYVQTVAPAEPSRVVPAPEGIPARPEPVTAVPAGTETPVLGSPEAPPVGRAAVPAVEAPPPQPSLVTPEPVIGAPIDRSGAAAGRPEGAAPVGETGGPGVVPRPGEVPGGARVGAGPGERPGDTAAARGAEQPAAQPALPAGEARPAMGAEPPVRPTETPAAESAPVARLTTEPDDVVPGQYVAKNPAGEVVGKGATPEAAQADAQARQNAPYPETAAPAAGPAAPYTAATPHPESVAARIDRLERVGQARTPEQTAQLQDLYRQRTEAERPPTEQTAREDQRAGLDTQIQALETQIRRAEARKGNAIAPSASLVRQREQLQALQQQRRALDSEIRAMEAADQGRYMRALYGEPERAEPTTQRVADRAYLEDQAVVPGPREDLGTTGPRETLSETGPALSTETPTPTPEVVSPRRTELPPVTPRPAPTEQMSPQLTRLTATRDALAAKTRRTTNETLKLSDLSTQVAKLRAKEGLDPEPSFIPTPEVLEARRGGRKEPFSGPPTPTTVRDALDYQYNDGTSVWRDVFSEAGHDPNCRRQPADRLADPGPDPAHAA